MFVVAIQTQPLHQRAFWGKGARKEIINDPPGGLVGDLREAPFVIGPMGPLNTKSLLFSIKRKEISQEELFLNW